ncbi:phosphoribosylanthranilate isomerase [Kiritimatiellaeota bacterium B1221]|nr:phosphoribosylanthranilate isomerase [Kiritimatiellaeota bacterium B1221]
MKNGLIKICGLANEGDVLETIAYQPDALGFIFYAKSPRAVTPQQVWDWTKDRVPAGMRKVGVFVDASVEEIQRSAEVAGLDVLQLHGGESAEVIRALELPVWKVLHLDRLPDGFETLPVEGLLIDSGTVEMPGGTGIRVDTDRAADFISQSKLPVLLAGGLKADTVADAILKVRPSGVDVASGVERAPGQKDLAAVRSFIQNARKAFLTL